MTSKTRTIIYILISILFMTNFLSCSSSIKLYGKVRYSAYPEDRPVLLFCPYEKEKRDPLAWDEDYYTLTKLSVLSNEIPGYERWKVHFDEKEPLWIQHGKYKMIGEIWVSAKRAYLDPLPSDWIGGQEQWYDAGQRMIEKGIMQFKTRAIEHGADAVVNIRFVGHYFVQAYSDGVMDINPVEERLWGIMIRRTDE